MAHAAEIVRKGRKFDQVLQGARQVFLADGFEGASVDDIARAAGVSKATLYSYFPDKRLLFMEVARLECLRQGEESLALIEVAATPRMVLKEAAERMLGFLLSDFGQRVFRICVAEADRFPELGRQFYETGPMMVRNRLTEFLTECVDRKQMEIDDIELAADQFAELCKADLFPRLVFNIDATFSEAEIARVIDGAVETFMARYAI
ncbi:TetR/AcrR family transcriptional regulator [Aestuariivita sp.]|jgi:AcrR family transcriptional regulator|uniref:TetR/AcrR family transcriptional regulator n=1 Tax=Aestuariivita sp. TaxID=1872407 RepID=UPI002174A2B9|nr:TetR/AcrR family transcriptional regulator [Aestuariivita sp.]MCE8007377.1 TetR/AcrR family transcriptional regulator [Aestuariivita sp.]